MRFLISERVQIYREIVSAVGYLLTSPQYQEVVPNYLVEVFHEVMGDRPVLRISRDALVEVFVWNEPSSQKLIMLFVPQALSSYTLWLHHRTEFRFGPGVEAHAIDDGCFLEVAWAVKEFLLFGKLPSDDSLVFRVPEEFNRLWQGMSGKDIQDFITRWGLDMLRGRFRWSKPFELPDVVGEIY